MKFFLFFKISSYFFVLFIINNFFRFFSQANRKMVQHTDSRVKITNELLQGIQCVKMYSWEKSFIGVIGSYRSKEMTSLKRIAYLIAGSRAYMYMVPAVVSLLSLSTYALIGGDVNPKIIFAALAAFNQVCS